MSQKEIIGLYFKYRNDAIKEGFSFESFWDNVCFYTDPLNSDSESWAIAGKCALESLRLERRIESTNC